MKTMNLFLTWIVFSLTILPAAQAALGPSNGGGGDSYAQEFTSIGKEVASQYDALGIEALTGVNSSQFQAVVNATQVRTIDQAVLDGRVLDAINYPAQKRIMLSRSRWSEIESDPAKKLGLVLHEYLSVAGASDANYGLSGKVVDELKPLLRQPDQPYSYSTAYSCDVYAKQSNSDNPYGLALIGHYDTFEGLAILDMVRLKGAGLDGYGIIFNTSYVSNILISSSPVLEYQAVKVINDDEARNLDGSRMTSYQWKYADFTSGNSINSSDGLPQSIAGRKDVIQLSDFPKETVLDCVKF